MRTTSLLFASLLLAPALARADTVDFKRTFKQGTAHSYAFKQSVEAVNFHGEIDVTETVDKANEDGTAHVKVHFDQLIPTSSSFSPEDLSSDIGPTNQPSAITMQKQSRLLFLYAFSQTPGKTVETGKPFEVSWAVDASQIAFRSTGVVESVDAAKKQFTVKWTLAVKTQGRDVGDMTAECVYDMTDCSLVSSKGEMGNGQPFDIERK
jgi:hypothetical protein